MANRWSNRLSFIITTSAFAVGLGNIWRFPYAVGEGGGGAFLLIYLLLIFLIGIPILTIEIVLGRMSRATPLTGFGKLSGKAAWNGVGWLNVAANMIILFYYVMILAWIIIYFGQSVSGRLSMLSTDDLQDHFSTIASDLPTILLVILGIMVASFFIVSRGLREGLERYAKFMMTTLIVIMIGLAVWAATLDGAGAGYRWYLYPDFSKINVQVILGALGQLFFSVGVGMAIAFVFGGYAGRKENLLTSVIWIVIADTLFAVLAGLMIFPALFSFGLPPDSGPNLIFVTMASVFGRLENGAFWGAVFFLLLFLGGFTSLIASLQGLKQSFQERFKLTPFRALVAVTTMVTAGSIPVVFSYVENPVRFFGMTVFGLFDYLTNTIMLPVGGLLIVVFGAFAIGFERIKTHLLASGQKMKVGEYWKPVIKWVIPLAVLVILLNGLFG